MGDETEPTRAGVRAGERSRGQAPPARPLAIDGALIDPYEPNNASHVAWALRLNHRETQSSSTTSCALACSGFESEASWQCLHGGHGSGRRIRVG
jgi:hypothetical protein